MTTPSSTSAPTLAARVDPPQGISAAVQALEARCDTWAPVAFPPGNRPKLTKEAQLCDQVTGGSTYPTDAFIDGVITGIFAGLFLAIFLRASRIWIGHFIEMLQNRGVRT